MKLTDPYLILAGIRQFGLASDGSDLTDLEAAISRLKAEIVCVKQLNVNLHERALDAEIEIEKLREKLGEPLA